MATARPFAYNPGTGITGTTQLGSLAIGYPTAGFAATGLEWWMGADEDLGYVIAEPVPSDTQPTPITGVSGSVGFYRSTTKTDADFISLSNVLANLSGTGPFSSATGAKTWLNANGYWTSFIPPVFQDLVLYYNPGDLSSYPGSGTTISDLSGNGLNGTMSNISFTSPYFTYNGTSSQVSIADNALLEPGSGSFTMEVWVRQSVSGNDVVLGKFDNGGLSVDVSYSIRTTGTAYYAQIGSGSGSGSSLFINSTTHTGTINTWYQIAYVFKNGATKTLETFVNGSSIGTVNHNLSSVLNTTNGLYIGSYNNGEYSQWFDGRIGIVRIYNSALSSSDVSQNFEANRYLYNI